MRLVDLSAPGWANKKRKRRGRGPGSGHGKTSCRGHKGLKARAGGKVRPGFEGGQMPLIRRIPKRGFTGRSRKNFQIVNLGALNMFDKGSLVGPPELLSRRLIKKLKPVKILGEGELSKSLIVKANSFSKGAIRKIEEAGGKVECLKP